MTKLEEELFDRIFEECRKAAEQNPMFHEHDSASVSSKAAAEVAKKYIEKAYIEGYYALPEIDDTWRANTEPSGPMLAQK